MNVLSHKNITLINDDCLNVLRALPDKAFDLAIVDPPFGIGENWRKDRSANHPRLVQMGMQRNAAVQNVRERMDGESDHAHIKVLKRHTP